ncbi:MAG: UDP-N-acetylglucosamine--N-acetylmuramyl-(pentapeptide) pyrophosphoryl-undecaprenol N-acetylglucosamine transferase, partial [Clostridia bacterium]|nr:UDP-N-acetylglucosamine--N-acetylmuramyl-(pentapeptide) pyrophosphoryl-undecaprenol N-acetylglucosamine transferase [Clostridia bacterium]
MSTIILTGGGTAGHCIPNVALIPYLKTKFKNIYYIGSENGIEKTIIKKLDIPYYEISCAKLNRSFDLKNLIMPFKVIKGINQAGKILDKLKPDVIFSKGGYVSLPIVIAGHKRNIPIISHESDITMGLSNKITCNMCKKVLTAFPETAEKLKNGEHVGIPLKKSLFTDIDKNKTIKSFGLSGKKPILLITGGSQGAKTINNAVYSALPTLLSKFEVIHVCGKGNLDSKVKGNGYFQVEFLSNLEDAIKICSVCVTRAGANTLFELLSLKTPCLA